MGKPVTIETRIKRERGRMSDLFKSLDKNKLSTVEPLIERAAFITVHLQDLEKELNKTGWTEEYQNGKDQNGVKRSAAADVHIALTKNLTAITKQLLELVPPEKKESKLKELMNE